MVDLRYADIRAETAVYTFFKLYPVGIFGPVIIQVPVDEMRNDSRRADTFTESTEHTGAGFAAQRSGRFFCEKWFEKAGKCIGV